MSAQAKLIDILLVEDNKCDIELTRQVFESSKVGNRLHVVTSGEDALDFLYRRGAYQQNVRPDIILLDLNLPSKSGYEILQIIRGDPQLKTIPVVILTGAPVDPQMMNNSVAHANCYLAKPVTFLSFISAIQSLEEFWLGLVTLPSAAQPKQLAS